MPTGSQRYGHRTSQAIAGARPRSRSPRASSGSRGSIAALHAVSIRRSAQHSSSRGARGAARRRQSGERRWPLVEPAGLRLSCTLALRAAYNHETGSRRSANRACTAERDHREDPTEQLLSPPAPTPALMGPAKMMSTWLLLATWSPLVTADIITFGAIVSDTNATNVSSDCPPAPDSSQCACSQRTTPKSLGGVGFASSSRMQLQRLRIESLRDRPSRT